MLFQNVSSGAEPEESNSGEQIKQSAFDNQSDGSIHTNARINMHYLQFNRKAILLLHVTMLIGMHINTKGVFHQANTRGNFSIN